MKVNVSLAKRYIKTNDGLNHAKVDIIPTEVVKNTKPNCFVFVIDKSGSMDMPFGRAQNNEYVSRLTCAKNSISKFLDKLSEEDKIAIVSFSNYALIEQNLVNVSEKNINEIKSNIHKIRAEGCTNMEDGLSKALSILKEVDSNKYSSKIILLSDGEANIGVSTADGLGKLASAIFENKIIVSTIGVGLSYNSEIMGAISTKGNGGMHHLDSFDYFDDILTEEFEATSKTVATNLKLKISNFGLIQVCENLNEYSQIEEDGYIYIELGDILRKKSLALEFRNDLETSNQKIKLCLSYMDMDGNIVTVETIFDLLVSDKEDPYENKDVINYVKDILSAANLTKSSGMYDSGDIKGSVSNMKSFTSYMRTLSMNYSSYEFSDSIQESSKLINSLENGSLSKSETKKLYSDSIKKRRE